MSRGVFSVPSKSVGYGLQHLPSVKRMYSRNKEKLLSTKQRANEYYREQYIDAYINAQSNAMAHRNAARRLPFSLYHSPVDTPPTIRGEKGFPRHCPGFGSWRTP